ncbi:MAG: metallophosphoesterase family protein [Gaiellaceae bacterium]
MQRGLLRTAALVVLCAGLALAGSIVALRAAAPASHEVTLGTVDVEVAPAASGSVDVYVPVVAWGVRAEPYRAPVAVELEFRSLDRDAALAAMRTGGSADASLAVLETELRDVVSGALRRAAAFALLGGLVGGLLGGSVAAGSLGRRRWLLLGPAAGLAASFAAVAVAGAGVSRFDYSALREPTFYAHGEELPRLLDFSERVLAAGDGYGDSYGEAVAGLTQLIAAAGDGGREPATIDRSIVVASDLHSNGLVLEALEGFTSGKAVFLVGDLTQRGTRVEAGILGSVARLGAPVVAVSGNHDSRPLMRAAAREGVIVLTEHGRLRPDGTTDGDPVVEVDGLLVAGWQDPLESATGTFEGRLLELKERALEDARREFLTWFAGLPERPDVVLVHRHGLAHALLGELAAEGGASVLILTGHDHRQHVETEGAHVLVDGGSVGAGGAFGVAEDPSGFALVHLDADDRAQSVDLVEVEPASGAASAHRVVIPEPQPADAAGRSIP